ncbi:MAG: DUF1638 domain-containing protein [Methanosarcinaceae archaeon]|nr:DUF1638 domain-containing protein [Methanosarcinaceae archaeon]
MPTMSLVACRMFEDEIVHLIENDSNISDLIVIDNDEYQGLVNKLNMKGIPYRILSIEQIPMSCDMEDGELRLVIDMLEFALHAVTVKLKEDVYHHIENMVKLSDGILLFYGLCGNVLKDVEEDFRSCGCKVSILKEKNGEIMDDCIGAVLGGRDMYLQTLKSFKGVGTFFLTPMWAANWREMMVASGIGNDPDDIETSRYIFDMVGYKQVAKVDTGLSYETDFSEKVNEFASTFDFDVLDIKANLVSIEQCYMKFRDGMLGTDHRH